MTPHFWPKNDKNARGDTSRKIGWGCAARFLKPLPYFRLKSVIFPTLFQTWSKIGYPISWSPGARRVTGARDKLLRHEHGSWRKHKREMVLSPNDEEVANSSKKHTQFKTRVHKPYPISDQNGRNWYPIPDQTAGKKNIPAAHTHIAYIRDSPLGGEKRVENYEVSLLTQGRLIIASVSPF